MDQIYKVVTFAGNGKQGLENGINLESTFNYPTNICLSSDGKLYVADRSNHVIRMIYNNEVATIAGNGQKGFQDGNALEAMFSQPTGICCSNDGRLYVADSDNNMVRMIHNGQVTKIAGSGKLGFKDGKVHKANFSLPSAICCSDGKLYVVDMMSSTIRMIYDDKVTTIAGTGKQGFQDGKSSKSMFALPTSICCSTDGRIYVSDYKNQRIRMIYDGQVTTIAGNGQKGFKDGNALEAMFNGPTAICCSKDGILYVAEDDNQRIRMICDDHVTTIAGNGEGGFQDGNALEAMFNHIWGLCYSNDSKLYIADLKNHRIRMMYNN